LLCAARGTSVACATVLAAPAKPSSSSWLTCARDSGRQGFYPGRKKYGES
jgi:hypothetical protein